MRATTIARNYAEALIVLARKANDMEGWGIAINAVASAMESDTKLKNFLAAPQVSSAQKSAVIGKAFGTKLPRNMVRFFQKLVQNRRQSIIPRIAEEYETLLDESLNIVHARVTVAKPLSEDEGKALADRLSTTIGRQVVPHIEVQPAILGGVIVRLGDVVMDGSLRRKLQGMKRRMTVRS